MVIGENGREFWYVKAFNEECLRQYYKPDQRVRTTRSNSGPDADAGFHGRMDSETSKECLRAFEGGRIAEDFYGCLQTKRDQDSGG